MITIETTLQNLNEATTTMSAMIESIPGQLFNTVPYEGSWTAGQLLRHIIKSDSSILATLKADAIPTANRNGDENVEGLKGIFLDFNQKFDAPDFIVPEAMDYDKDILLAAFRQGREEITAMLQQNDVLYTCTTHPIFTGHTKLEMIWFVIVHTMRHNRQLEKIKGALTA